MCCDYFIVKDYLKQQPKGLSSLNVSILYGKNKTFNIGS